MNVMEDLEQANATIEIEKKKFEAILASIADAVFACDHQGIILLFNKSAEIISEISAKKAIGQHYLKVINIMTEGKNMQESDFISEAMNQQIATTSKPYSVLRKLNGIAIPISGSAAPIINPQSKLYGCVVVLHDVTREREIDRVKSEFVSLASHQLRTPLTAINWLTEILLSESTGTLNPEQKSQVEETLKSSKRMVSLIDALLNVSRLELGTMPIKQKVVNIADAVKICVEELEPKISKKNIHLMIQFDKTLRSFQTDPKLLDIVILNLLSNAIKYSRPKGNVSLIISKQVDNIKIDITDNGIGIPLKQQGMIFTKLFRADNALAADPDGTGLGLYLVKAVTESLGGNVSFVSTEGQGSTFSISLPISGLIKK